MKDPRDELLEDLEAALLRRDVNGYMAPDVTGAIRLITWGRIRGHIGPSKENPRNLPPAAGVPDNSQGAATQ